MIAVRSNERAAAALGVSVFRVKLSAFAIAGAIAGLAGAMLAFQYEYASFVGFDAFSSLLTVGWVVIGGVGFVPGALIGALLAPGALLSLVGLRWDGIVEWLPMAGGVGALLAVRFNQHDIAHSLRRLFRGAFVFSSRDPRAMRRELGATVSGSAVIPERAAGKLLRIENLTVWYGGVTAVDSVSIQVDPGEVVGLIGPNGAGKTSLVDAVSGFTDYRGTVVLEGSAIDRWSPHRRAAHGLVRSFQGLELFPELRSSRTSRSRAAMARASDTAPASR